MIDLPSILAIRRNFPATEPASLTSNDPMETKRLAPTALARYP